MTLRTQLQPMRCLYFVLFTARHLAYFDLYVPGKGASSKIGSFFLFIFNFNWAFIFKTNFTT